MSQFELRRRPDYAKSGAFYEFGPGRVDDFGVQQLTMLAPGTYQFRGTIRLTLLASVGFSGASRVRRTKAPAWGKPTRKRIPSGVEGF